MAFSFKPTDIKRTCGFQAYQRGIAYWKDNKVLDIKLTDQSATQQIISHVAGSHGEIYTTQIEILEYDEGDCEIIGECTCPVQIDCKHVAATLLKTLQEGPQALTSASTDLVSDWLDSLEAARREPETDSETAPASPYRLLYVLESNPERQDPYAIELVTQKVRLLKKGGYGKPSAFPLEKASETYYANDFLRQEDRDIAQLITNARNYYYYNYSNRYTLKREMGRLALEKILATGRCHWGDKDNPPLRPGDARELRFEWRDMGDGKQLEAVIEPAVSYLFRCEGFWFVDLDQQEAGPLSHPDLDSRQVEALLKAPVVPREQLEDISRKLILELPEYRLTPPVELEIETIDISGHNPKPRLRLMQIDSRTARTSAQGLHCARLSLDYGAVEVREPLGDNPLTQIVDGNRVYRVERDGDAERALFATLRNAGLRLLPTTPDRPRMDWQYETAPGDAASKAAQWDRFISETLPQLEAAGWTIEFDDSFQLRFEESDDWLGEFEESDNDWFSLSLGVELDGQRIDLLPLLVDILKAAPNARALKDHLQSQSAFLVEIAENQYLKIPSARLLPIFDTLVELYDQDPLDEHGKLNLSKQQALQLDGLLNNPTLTWRGAEELMALNRRLRDFSAIQPVPTPAGFNAELREYQQQGLSWLQFLVEYGFSGILADDMGLGKTIQTLAHLLTEKQAGRLTQPALIIAPTSLIANWRREANRFAPDLSVLVLHGPQRQRDFPRIDAHDLIITSYPLIRRDADNYREREFHLIVLDEAQAIKNPKSATTQAIFGLQATHRLCLSGTPVENHLGEFWSIFHFLMPGFLGNLQRFNRLYRNPIEKQQDDIRRDQLARRVRPFVLRRTKDEVAS
ncbi:MAG TPA: hypothetical protein ENK26_04855, partial [Gammaproteobacteria bacterium]|nr:hypothetical protein [Gammaproteobacteria bacterium]